MSVILNYGMITASTVYLIDKNFKYPRPNEYAEIDRVFDSVGGEAVNSAIMLSKLGIKTKLDGNWINSKHAPKIFSLLKPFDIDVSRLTVKDNFGTEEIVIVDSETRTFFGNFAKFHSGQRQWNAPNEEDVINSRLVVIDPYFKPDAEEMAKLCVKHNKPFVTLDCKFDSFLGSSSDAIIISFELRDQAYPGMDHKELFTKYLNHCKGLVVFTFGSDELWFGRKGSGLQTFKPFNITPVDTTAAGDSFRAGIVYGLLQNYSDLRTVEFASAVAANVCLSIPHTLNAPGLPEILKFIEIQNKSGL